jgi:hypothetical protein
VVSQVFFSGKSPKLPYKSVSERFYTVAHQAAQHFYTRPDRWTAKAKAISQKAQTSSFIPRQFRKMQASIIQFATKWTQQDYHEVFPVKIGNKTLFQLMNIPIGSLLLILYVFTIPPRVYQAYKRGKKDNDFREIGDVLRRDLLAITLLVFALGKVTPWLGKRVQNKRGVVLVNPRTGQMLNYSSFRNYAIDSAAALKAILTEGNARGLSRAVQQLHDQGVAKVTGDKRLEIALNDLSSEVDILSHAWQTIHDQKGIRNSKLLNLAPCELTPEALDKRIKRVFNTFEETEALRVKVREDILHNNPTSQGLRVVEGLGNNIPNVLERYAKTSRLPSDIASFALATFLTGFLPVWFNKQWNQFQYNRKEKRTLAEQPLVF